MSPMMPAETLGDLASRLLPTDRQLARLDIPASVKLTDIEKAFITRWAIDTHAVAFVIAQRGLTGCKLLDDPLEELAS